MSLQDASCTLVDPGPESTGTGTDRLFTLGAIEAGEWIEPCRWMPVGERLPPNACPVLVWHADPLGGGEASVGVYRYLATAINSEASPWWSECIDRWGREIAGGPGPVTHWQPLPEPPEEP
jgi:hypothetical protein